MGKGKGEWGEFLNLGFGFWVLGSGFACSVWFGRSNIVLLVHLSLS
jgi:hypothetical protein